MPQRGKLMDLVNEFDDEQLQENISAENRAETTLEILLQKIGERQLLKMAYIRTEMQSLMKKEVRQICLMTKRSLSKR